MLEPTKRADGDRIRSLRAAKKLSQEELAQKAGCSVRTVQNAEAGKRTKEVLLDCIAGALEVCLADITSPNPEPEVQFPTPVTGNPEHYMQALQGTWRTVVSRYPGIDRQGRPVESIELEYDVKILSTAGNTLTASCQCVSQGFEHERFQLKATVDGNGLLLIDGYRDVPDGAVHFFRSIMQYHSDGRSKMMEGGFVVFDLDPSGIFVGRMKSVPRDASKSQGSPVGRSKERRTAK